MACRDRASGLLGRRRRTAFGLNRAPVLLFGMSSNAGAIILSLRASVGGLCALHGNLFRHRRRNDLLPVLSRTLSNRPAAALISVSRIGACGNRFSTGIFSHS